MTVGAPDGEAKPVWVLPLVMAGVLCFAGSAILVRYASAAPGMAVAALRTSFAILLLAPVGIPATMKVWRNLGRRDVWLILGAGFLLGIHFVMWISSIYYTSVASAAVLVATGPIFMALFGFLLLGERISRRTTLAIFAAVAGSVLLGLAGGKSNPPIDGNPLLGNALALGAAVVWALYLLIGRVVRRRVDWLPYVFPLYVVAGLTTLAFAVGSGTPLGGYPMLVYLLCVAMAVFPQILGHGSFNYAVKFYPAAFLGLVSLLEPIGAAALGLLLFDELPGPLAVVGMVIILVAVGSTLTEKPEVAPAAAD
ncbi:MAG: DMT family transporter [Rhodothermales bacterium]|nr:DMT family transporter [Rhodothermales bacterium]MBO6780608.1 DMT family transporter [Rhodothermales bacterium]